jgi:DNA-binding SARP family transcriptional activator
MTQIQAHISHLRRSLDPDLSAGASGSLIETRPPGYLVRLRPEQLDLRRFERLTAEASDSSARHNFAAASSRLRDALGLWRGPALAEFARDPFAQAAIARLEDMRINALADRFDAELALGRHAELVGELHTLAAESPLRERFRAQLMLALYRSGRQAEALDVYRAMRDFLVEQLGIEPGLPLQELERAILTHSESLELPRPAPTRSDPSRSVLVVASNDARLDALLTIAELPMQDLILVRPVVEEVELAPATAAVNARRRTLSVPARAASFISTEPARDIVRLASSYDVELVLLDARIHPDDALVPLVLAEILERSPADVAILTGEAVDLRSGDGVFVPFGGGEHDWAALELAAWLASSAGVPVRLVGTRAMPRLRQRDASRLLADASLVVQRLVQVDTEPLLAEPTEDALVAAVADAALVVVGISPRWRSDGIGAMRRALVRAELPVLLTHRGPRPGGLAPRDGRTRFTWSLES